MKTTTTADGFEVKITKMFYTTPWEGVIFGNLHRDWAFGEHLRGITTAIPYTASASWHYLHDNREEPPETHMYSVAMRLEGDAIPDIDDRVCGSHAFVSTIVHVGAQQSFQEALEDRIRELTWKSLAINWDF